MLPSYKRKQMRKFILFLISFPRLKRFILFFTSLPCLKRFILFLTLLLCVKTSTPLLALLHCLTHFISHFTFSFLTFGLLHVRLPTKHGGESQAALILHQR